MRPLSHSFFNLQFGEAVGLEGTGRLWNSLGDHLHDIADYAGARANYGRALPIGLI